MTSEFKKDKRKHNQDSLKFKTPCKIFADNIMCRDVAAIMVVTGHCNHIRLLLQTAPVKTRDNINKPAC